MSVEKRSEKSSRSKLVEKLIAYFTVDECYLAGSFDTM